MTEDEVWSWIGDSFENLQLNRDYLDWIERNLSHTIFHKPDMVDKLSYRLISSVLAKRDKLLLVLPDKNPQRPAFIFSIALLMHWINCEINNWRNSQILYFGLSAVAIREQLKSLNLKTNRKIISLNRLFPQSKMGRTGFVDLDLRSWGPHLPHVIYISSPVNPLLVLQQYNADWIAVDCGDKSKLLWIQPILDYIQESNTPLIAWGQNHLSDWVTEFIKADVKVFRWPKTNKQPIKESTSIAAFIKEYFQSSLVTRITPIIVNESSAEAVCRPLEQAYRMLAVASSIESPEQVAQDTFRIGWRLLRALEALSVPLELYEAESKHFWGLKQITMLRNAFSIFVAQLVDTDLGQHLEKARIHMNDVYAQLQTKEPPLWSALTEICFTEVPEKDLRFLIFPSRARKLLFAFVLLARYNITEKELKERRIVLTCLDDFDDYVRNLRRDDNLCNYHSLRSIFVGLPSSLLSAKMEPLLQQDEMKFLIYPHQLLSLYSRVKQWNEALSISLENTTKILADLSELAREKPQISDTFIRLIFDETEKIAVETATVKSLPQPTPLLPSLDSLEEVARIFDDETELEEDTLVIEESDLRDEKRKTLLNAYGELWVEEAIEIIFEEGWQILIAPDDKMNVIYQTQHGLEIEERYARSLRVGDRVLFIYGQKRQSLYELIISRVHNLPAMRLHIALIQRWHEELLREFKKKQVSNGWDADELLTSLQAYGSRITTPQTIQSWLNGDILCPEDPQDLHRLGEVLNISFLDKYYRKIFRAAQRLRGIHRGLAIKLNHRVQQLATGMIEEEDLLELVDEDLGLTLQDFWDSLLDLRIQSIEHKRGPFYLAGLGAIKKREI